MSDDKGEKVKVILGQLGSPKSTSTKDVREYLREFLGDPRVVDINPLAWKLILNLLVLPFRPKQSAKAYGRILAPEGFPLITNTIKVADALRPKLDPNLEINHAFLLSTPRIGEVLDAWEKEDVYERAQRVLVLPQFPQYAESTIGSVVDVLGGELKKRVNLPTFTVLNSYHRSHAFIDHSVRKIQQSLVQHPDLEEIVISFHGIPLRRVLVKQDLYLLHCLETFELIKSQLGSSRPVTMYFQSRFGSEVWLGPYTDESVVKKITSGVKKIGVYCPSFVVDCLETTDEIGHELGHKVKQAGGELVHIPCLNADEEWIRDYANFINVYANGNQSQRQELFYKIDVKERYKAVIKEQEKNAASALPPESKKILKLMFLTMFMDLVGFSIIFPMFPAMAKHYLSVDSDNFFLSGMMNLIGNIQSISGGSDGSLKMSTVVLFGGLLGALYSLLQFLAAPMWGTISDRIGRRPVLLISVFGLFLSYILWIFSGSFTLLIAARLVGGLMSGNLSIASAVVSDVTDEKNRSKGMAVIGIAFALGFVIGPAMGGILSMYNPILHHPEWAAYGVNPFSAPALLAAVLCFINFFTILKSFPETLKPGTKAHLQRSINPLKLLRPLPLPGVNLTNFAYFLFITAFSGMEFTLTFLAVERLGYSSMDNAYMFIFIGLVIGFVQGGYVRRKAHQVGERKMSFHGLVCIIPGLILLAFANAAWMLYAGLFFLAAGSAMIIPCLTTLASFYSPKEMQGQSLGIFRSLGALGRVIGPIYASLVYWRFGSVNAYLIGAALIFLPAILVKRLPAPVMKES
ncbi:MAG TPA: ferrochelatase [Bacteriovoracaceae bacterium]|nr:ferrochelatase [Bacteriovoracaceae bacterium]